MFVVTEGIRSFAPRLQLADVFLNRPESKFPKGTKVRSRCSWWWLRRCCFLFYSSALAGKSESAGERPNRQAFDCNAEEESGDL